MGNSASWAGISIAVLVMVALLVFPAWREQRPNRLTPLGGMAFALVLAGLIFGKSSIVGHPLLGSGALLAIVDILRRHHPKGRS